MAYDWPDGWNGTRTERAVQGFVCDTLDVPKYAVRCSIDSDEVLGIALEIFKPLGGKPTDAVHEVFGRVAQFTSEGQALQVGLPLEKTGHRTMRLRHFNVWMDE